MATQQLRRQRLVFVGDTTSGKTQALFSFIGKSSDTSSSNSSSTSPTKSYMPTVFEDHVEDCLVNGAPNEFTLCDTAGVEEYARLRPITYSGADTFVICFSLLDRTALERAKTKWAAELRSHEPKVPILLVGLRKRERDDMRGASLSRSAVSTPDGEAAAKDIRAVKYIECAMSSSSDIDAMVLTAAAIAFRKAIKRQRPKIKRWLKMASTPYPEVILPGRTRASSLSSFHSSHRHPAGTIGQSPENHVASVPIAAHTQLRQHQAHTPIVEEEELPKEDPSRETLDETSHDTLAALQPPPASTPASSARSSWYSAGMHGSQSVSRSNSLHPHPSVRWETNPYHDVDEAGSLRRLFSDRRSSHRLSGSSDFVPRVKRTPSYRARGSTSSRSDVRRRSQDAASIGSRAGEGDGGPRTSSSHGHGISDASEVPLVVEEIQLAPDVAPVTVFSFATMEQLEEDDGGIVEVVESGDAEALSLEADSSAVGVKGSVEAPPRVDTENDGSTVAVSEDADTNVGDSEGRLQLRRRGTYTVRTSQGISILTGDDYPDFSEI